MNTKSIIAMATEIILHVGPIALWPLHLLVVTVVATPDTAKACIPELHWMVLATGGKTAAGGVM